MKQVIQNLRTGATEVAEVPTPIVRPHHLLIRTSRSLISAGTERMLLEFGNASLVQKARQRPDKVRQVLDKVRTDGLLEAAAAVREKLDHPLPLGYCNVGTVLAVGAGVFGFRVGDRVVSNGPHAEVVAVPMNLCAPIPAGVDDDAAAFTVLGAVALEGIRLAQPTLGETVVVMGLGVIGQLAVQLLLANGCRVLATDFDEQRLAMAKRLGAEVANPGRQDAIAAAHAISRGRGVDAVVVTASTASSEPIHQAATMCRKRGRIVLVGVTGLELQRADFYDKELSFQVSCSYGPGRYDPTYEEKGQDYPLAFARWTAQRNFEAVLDLLGRKALDVQPLVSHRFLLEEAGKAYGIVSGQEGSMGILLDYASAVTQDTPREQGVEMRTVEVNPPRSGNGRPAVGFIGSGNHAMRTLIPAFKAAGARLRTVASARGLSGLHAARRHGFERAASEVSEVLGDPDTWAVVVATRHDTHAALAIAALEAGKDVFVEKPLCIDYAQLGAIEAAYAKASTKRPVVAMVGFNRRFAPMVVAIKDALAGDPAPKAFVMTVNAGAVPVGHWTMDAEVGGGRILGEGCHFIDLLRHLAGHPIVETHRMDLGSAGDSSSITLRFADGSLGTVHYLTNGSRRFPKERLTVFAGGGVLELDNFRRLRVYGGKGKGMRSLRQDKGQAACAQAFLDAVSAGRPSPIPWEEVLEVSRVAIDIAGAAREA